MFLSWGSDICVLKCTQQFVCSKQCEFKEKVRNLYLSQVSSWLEMKESLWLLGKISDF